MKNQFFFLSLALAALLSGCAKNEADTPDTGAPATHITAKAQGRGDIPLDTKSPVTGTSLDGQTAEVYASTYDISNYTGSLLTTFSNVYARGTMTFNDANYVGFDKADFGGLDGGKSLLPQDGTVVYLYGFYPKGWDRTVSTPGGPGSENESLTYLFDGKTDVMSTWLTQADNLTIKYNDVANMPDKADFTFKHLLTRYNIRIKANDAEAITAWGHVKSIQIKEADPTKPVNQVWYDKSTTMYGMSCGYLPHETNTTPTAFYKLTGADLTKPTYSDDKFEAADYAASQSLTTTEANACYTMVAPIDVSDADPLTPELTLEVVTIDAANKEKTVEIPVSLLQNKFPEVGGSHSTRGYSITLTLNFRVGVIQAIATVEEWKEYGNQNIDVDMPTPGPAKFGDVKDGGIVYEVTDAKNYKVFSLTQGSGKWAAARSYVLGAGDGQDVTDGKKNMSAIKAYFDANTGTVGSNFAVAFPAAGFCDAMNTGGVSGWYLPAKDELKALYTVYTVNKVVLDKAIMDNSGTAMAGSVFWSGTEHSGSSTAWYVDFSDGYMGGNDKNNGSYVRCVKSITPPPAIGALKNGGIVYEVTDANNYKVFSLTEGSGLAWSAANSYILGAGDGQDVTDGKKNMSAIKAYFDANTGTVGSDFSVAFPAAAYCKGMNTGGVTGWYLPAKDELVALYTAYTANKAVLDKALTDNSGTAISASDSFWSGTEANYSSSFAWSVLFSYGGSSGSGKSGSYSVRCVRAN